MRNSTSFYPRKLHKLEAKKAIWKAVCMVLPVTPITPRCLLVIERRRPMTAAPNDCGTRAEIELSRGLPASVGAEKSILGAILLDSRAFSEAAEHLKPSDFSSDSHRRIFACTADLAESSKPIDLVMLVEELDRRKELRPLVMSATSPDSVDGVPDRPSISTTYAS